MSATVSVVITVLVLAVATTFPSSIVLAGVRRGRWSGYGLLAVLGGMAYALGGPGGAAWMLALFGLSGLAMAWGLARFERADAVFAVAWGFTLAAIALNAGIIAGGMGLGLADVNRFFQADAAHYRDFLVQYGMVPQEQMEALAQVPVTWMRTMFALVPGAYAFGIAVIIWLNLVTVVRLAPPGRWSRLGDLSLWSAPEPAVFAVLLPGIVFAAAPDWRWQAAAGNVALAAAVPFFLQGMAIFAHTLRRYRLGPALRMLAYLLVLGFLGLMIVPVVTLAGVLDIWLDFRRLRRPAAPNEDETADDRGDDE